jgi:beta-aspartyl-peptidase (threonine type)
VGDSPLAGCGFYADDALGAVAVSGDGESVVRFGLARHVLMARQVLNRRLCDPAQGVTSALHGMAERVGGEAGLILVTPEAEVVWDHTSPNFAVAWQTSAMPEPVAALEQRAQPVAVGIHGPA